MRPFLLFSPAGLPNTTRKFLRVGAQTRYFRAEKKNSHHPFDGVVDSDNSLTFDNHGQQPAPIDSKIQ